MGKNYIQLKLDRREKLYKLCQEGFWKVAMVSEIGCHRSTIYRELRRNKSRIGYLPDKAQKLSLCRRKKTLKIDRDPELRSDIIDKLESGWSPEIISGYLKKEKGISVISHETIYAYIYSKSNKASYGLSYGIYH